jgi:polar amino acid transport system substrate-binding protein
MRIILGVFMALLLMHVAQATELTFNTQDFAPFNYAIDGVVSGPVAELIRNVCDEMQITCSFRLLAWTRAQEEVRLGKAHGMFVIGWNAARAKWLHFTPPILYTEYGFFVRDDNTLRFKDVNDVKGYRVGVYGPSNTSKSLENIKAQVQDLTIDMRPNDEAGFKKLSVGRIDAVFSNRDVGYALIAKLKLNNIRYAGMQRRLKYYIGFSQTHTDKKLVDQFNATLVDFYRRGVAQAILKTYNMEPVALNEMEGTASGNK